MEDMWHVCAMGPATAVLLSLGLVVLISSFGLGCGQSSAEEEVEDFRPRGYSLSSQFEGRGKKKTRVIKTRSGLKVLGFVILVPAVVGVVLFAAWKGITIALLAFVISAIVGLSTFFTGKWQNQHQHKDDVTYTHNVVVAKNPGLQEHWWRKVGTEILGTLNPENYKMVPATGMANF